MLHHGKMYMSIFVNKCTNFDIVIKLFLFYMIDDTILMFVTSFEFILENSLYFS